LPVLARKPAPLQFEWLGYLCTTGVSAIDYRLCDAVTDPPGAPAGSERIARLPQSQWCYEPLRELPAIGELPARNNGFWTFGSFNQGSKLNVPTLQRWARVLNARPGSRMRFVGIEQERLARRIVDAFAAEDIDAKRIDILGRIPVTEYMDAFNAVDIAFDTYPYSGATTTCDALIMGVPVATAVGERGISRSTASILAACGLEDWIAPSTDAFVEMVLSLTADADRLALLRASLRERLVRSPVMNASSFTRALEKIFRDAWRERLADQPGA
jgi:predicted O-linked N-acetylglucosamine transferase (SPINDLY family)